MHGIDNGFESFPQESQGIFHLGGDLRIDFSMDNSILFQFPQLLGKHFLGNAGQGPMELAKALDAVEQFPQARGRNFMGQGQGGAIQTMAADDNGLPTSSLLR